MTQSQSISNPGISAALGAAVLFGAGTPLAKHLLSSISPWLLAGLLYLGSGIGLTLYRWLTDTGIGMTAEQTARIFERFYRADGSGNIPGSGLGMTIVKEIIDVIDGRIEINSALGEGTSVTLLLPAAG